MSITSAYAGDTPEPDYYPTRTVPTPAQCEARMTVALVRDGIIPVSTIILAA